MLYVTDGKNRIQLTNYNIEAKCPECGRFHRVDLIDLLAETETIDLEDLDVLCPKCSSYYQ